MFCAYTRSRYLVSVYRTIGPLIICSDDTHVLVSVAIKNILINRNDGPLLLYRLNKPSGISYHYHELMVFLNRISQK